MTGRPCTVCTHPEHDAIDRDLVQGRGVRAVAERWGISPSAAARHRAEHLVPRLVPATTAVDAPRLAPTAAEVTAADDLLGQLLDLQRRTLAILDAAEADGDRRDALRAVAEARRNLELLAELAGELDRRQTVNVLVSPSWQAVRGAIVACLAPFPEARAAVAERLAELEAGDA